MGEIDTNIDFRLDFGLYWPRYDHAPIKCYERVMARYKDCDQVTARCNKRRNVIQAGGHVGVWPRRLAKSFENVYTFEPDPYLNQCLWLNTESTKNIQIFKLALGDRCGRTKMAPHASAGSWRVDEDNGTYEVGVISIDEFGVDVDAIVLDIEGSEPKALLGGRKTIERCSPVILLEEGKKKHELRAFMQKTFGYIMVKKIHDDAVYIKCS